MLPRGGTITLRLLEDAVGAFVPFVGVDDGRVEQLADDQGRKNHYAHDYEAITKENVAAVVLFHLSGNFIRRL